jgi:hypothetical protein
VSAELEHHDTSAVFTTEAEPTADFFPDIEGDTWDAMQLATSEVAEEDELDAVTSGNAAPPVDLYIASVHVNVSALRQAAPVLCDRFGSECANEESALAPVYVKAAGVAFARVFARDCTVAMMRAEPDTPTKYQIIRGCATAMLPELLRQCSPDKGLQVPPADADLALLNAGEAGADEFMGLAGAPAPALLALGASRESAEARGGRIERAYICKATITVKTGEWPVGKALAFLQEFRQLLEHPVLLVGV